jgi:hypothetical protein
MGVFFVRSVPATIFAMPSETATDRLANPFWPPVVRGPQFEKHCSKESRNCALAASRRVIVDDMTPEFDYV